LILVDTRAGSQDLIAPLAAAGLPVEETRLDFGDVAFMGRGVGGAATFCGVEHKRLSDLVQSLNTDRLAGHQLTGMLDTFDRCYLVIEGTWESYNGRVMVTRKGLRALTPLKGAPPAVELEKRVLTLQHRGGLAVRWTNDQAATVRYLTALYRWWTDHDLDAHKSHLAIHAPDLDSALRRPVSDFQRVVAQIPGIGLKRSAAVDAAFDGSFRRLMLATEAEWAEITTTDNKGKARKLGPAAAKKILEALK
jgi:ERCC4-type nuclease